MFSVNHILFMQQTLQRKKKRLINLRVMDKNEKEKSGTNCSYSIASILGFGKILFLKNPGIFLRKVLVGCGGPQLTALEYLFCTT